MAYRIASMLMTLGDQRVTLAVWNFSNWGNKACFDYDESTHESENVHCVQFRMS